MYRIEQGTECKVYDRDEQQWFRHIVQRPLTFMHAEKLGDWWLFTMIDWLLLVNTAHVKHEMRHRKTPKHIASFYEPNRIPFLRSENN